MAQITLRGIEPKVEKKIRVLAKKSGKSLNRVILDILYQNSVLDKKDRRAPANSLSKLAGGWSKHDAQKFLDSIKPCRQIDEEMWK